MTYTIELHYDEVNEKDHFLTLYRPVPATDTLPDWFKKLDNQVNGFRTAKSCRGLFDVMTMGYTIVWTFDVLINKDEHGKLFIKKARDGGGQDFSAHPHLQMGMYPDAHLHQQQKGVEKVNLPYRVVTPRGTSVMLVQPPYRPDLKTEIMPGVIDSDKFYSPLNVLFTIKDIPVGKEIRISAGTPLAQLVPFVRTEWKLRFKKVDQKKFRVMQSNMDNLDKYYQKFLWTRKIFKKDTEN